MTPLSPPKPILPNDNYQKRTLPTPGQDLLFGKTISQMGSPDLTIALQVGSTYCIIMLMICEVTMVPTCSLWSKCRKY